MTDDEFQDALRARLLRQHEANARKAELEAEIAEMQRDAVRAQYDALSLKTPSTAPGGVS